MKYIYLANGQVKKHKCSPLPFLSLKCYVYEGDFTDFFQASSNPSAWECQQYEANKIIWIHPHKMSSGGTCVAQLVEYLRLLRSAKVMISQFG